MTQRQADFVLCIVLWLVAIIFWFQAKELKSPGNLLPTMLVIIISLLAGIVFVKNVISLVKEKQMSSRQLFTRENFIKVGMVSLATLVYVFVIPVLGFYLSTGIFLSLFYLLMTEGAINGKRIMQSVLGGVVVSIGIFYTFGYLLHVHTPKGILF